MSAGRRGRPARTTSPVSSALSRLRLLIISTNAAPGNGTWAWAQSVSAQMAWAVRRSSSRSHSVTYPARSPSGRSIWNARSRVAGGTLPVASRTSSGLIRPCWVMCDSGPISAQFVGTPKSTRAGGSPGAGPGAAGAAQRRRLPWPRPGADGGGTQGGDHAAEAVAQHRRRRAGGVGGRGVRRGEVVIDVGGHGVLGVALVRDAPVDEEDVVAAR